MSEQLTAAIQSLGKVQLTDVLDSLPFGLALLRLDGTASGANAEFYRIFGTDPSKKTAFSHKEALEALGVSWAQLSEGIDRPIRVEPGIIGGGAWVAEITSSRKILDGDEEKILISVMDISLRERMERALRESETRVRGYFEQDLVGMARLSTDLDFLEINETLCRLSGRSRNELLQSNHMDLIVGGDRVRCRELTRGILNGETDTCVHETDFMGTEGRIIPLRIHYSRNQTMPGQDVDFVAIYEDIAAEKEATRMAEEQRQHLIRADRMTTLGTLVAGTAHEISNPNQVILGNVELAETLLSGTGNPVDERVGRFLARIGEGARRIDAIVEDLKDYARSADAADSAIMNLNESVLKAVSLLDRTIDGATDRFVLDLEKNLPPVSANPDRIEQIVVNLLMNGCHALPEKNRELRLRSYQDGSNAVFEVLDEGVGIPEEILKKITDPFVTTRRSDGGTGLGLSVSDGIARDYGGKLEFSNRTDSPGASARLLLPITVY